jgi:hypothetical protein
MGGGRFIGKDGSVRDLSYDYSKGPELELPEDVLPSGMELERNLEAVTISHEYMDDDLKAALFEGADEEGEFEELQDDFVVQVMNAPEEADFDFDAHIAELIAKRFVIVHTISRTSSSWSACCLRLCLLYYTPYSIQRRAVYWQPSL